MTVNPDDRLPQYLLFIIYYLLIKKNKKIFIKNPAMCQWQDFSIKLKHKLKPCT